MRAGHGHNHAPWSKSKAGCRKTHVFDFIAPKTRTKEITDELDHHMLATKNAVIEVEERGKSVHVLRRSQAFPRRLASLPIENTTAELLARYIAGRLLDSLRTDERFVRSATSGKRGKARPSR